MTTDHYDRDAPTKQNLLCNRQAALEMMLNHPDLKDNDNAGPVQDGSDQVLTKKIRNVESFQIELVCLYFSYKLFLRKWHSQGKVSVGTVGAAASTDFDDADFTPKILKKVDFESVIFIQNSL